MVLDLGGVKTRQILIRVSVTLFLALLLLLAVVTPVYATVDDPSAISVDSVFVYQHCLEEDDQLYLVEYTITYGTNPDENATEAYLFRLMNGTTELGNVAPYAYYDEGYGYGIAAIYFYAADAPAWEGSYTMKFEGNPTLTWTDGTPPVTSVSTFNSWSSSPGISTTQNELAARILYLADLLELDWGVNMIDTAATGSYLSDYGVAYFTNVIESVQTMAPGAFAGSSTAPDWETKEVDTTYADSRADSVEDTPLDLTDLADAFGISRLWASTVLYILGAGVMVYFALAPTGSFRPLILLSAPLIVAGGYMGMLPLLFTVLAGVGAFILSLFLLFYHPSTA